MLKIFHTCCLALVVYTGPIYQVSAETVNQLQSDYESQCKEQSFLNSVLNFNRGPQMGAQTGLCRQLLSNIQYKNYVSIDKNYYNEVMPLPDAEFRYENQALLEVNENQLGGYLLNDESLIFFEMRGSTEPTKSSTATSTKDQFGNFIISN